MRTIISAIIVVLSISSIAFASGLNSQELYEECHKLDKATTDPKSLASEVYCFGYVDGVVDGYRITTDLNPQVRFICLPQTGLTNEIIVEIFSKWLKKNPKDRQTPARSGVLLSLQAAFPCK